MQRIVLLIILSVFIPLSSQADDHPFGLSENITLVNDETIDSLVNNSDRLVVLITINDTYQYGYFKTPERIQLFNQLSARYGDQVHILVALRSHIPERKCDYAAECLITRPTGTQFWDSFQDRVLFFSNGERTGGWGGAFTLDALDLPGKIDSHNKRGF
ncbi:hypothetical protein [uncultured Endozoicomonas sp.]|uniref:hypothetical protein n=1 Tax=uncultured Endozoicomonas sp. TaxID=432652 RepID=UPI00261EFFDE|nr:hypothetical protein [uncultured Endozoicomonas sp.]